MENELIKEIDSKCRKQFQFAEDFEKIIKINLVSGMNKYSESIDTDEKESLIAKTITFLACQGIRSYGSSILLIRNGYATNALANLRTLVEITLTIEYILKNEESRYKRALKYINSDNTTTVYKKAGKSLNNSLYGAYKILCEYTHGNFKATIRNKIENIISINPNDILVNETTLFTNAIMYNFLEILSRYYNFGNSVFEEINVPHSIEEYAFLFNNKSVVEGKIIDSIFAPLGITREEIDEIKSGYHKYIKDKKSNKNKKKSKK